MPSKPKMCEWYHELERPYSGLVGCVLEAGHQGDHEDYQGSTFSRKGDAAFSRRITAAKKVVTK